MHTVGQNVTHKKDHYGQSCLLFEWRGRAGAVYLCFPDKKCPKCHVYEYPTPGDTVFASLLTISANLNQEQKVPQICEQQSRSQASPGGHQVTWSPHQQQHCTLGMRPTSYRILRMYFVQ